MAQKYNMKKLSGIWILMFIAGVLHAQERTLTGLVKTNTGQPLEKASVHLVNTAFNNSTDVNGTFTINYIPRGNYFLEVSAIGYAVTTVPVRLLDTTIQHVDVILIPSFSQLDAVLVTAQKKEEQLRDLPLSITALNSRAIQQFRIWKTNEITAVVPNLYAAHPGDQRTVTSIRGITTTSYDPAIATYVDGVNQFGLDTYLPQLFDVERIEVLRGPQGTLYGRNAMGGVINIITHQPSNTTSGFAEASVGNYGLQRYVGAIRTPVIKDQLYVGLTAGYSSLDGYFTNEFNGKNFDDQNTIHANMYLRWLPDRNWSVTLNGKTQRNRNMGTFPLQVPGPGGPVFDLNQDAVTELHDDINNASLSIGYSGNAFNFSSQTAAQSNYRFYEDPIDADFSPIDGVTIINNYGRDWNNVKVYTQEFRFSSPANTTHRMKWTAGSYLFSQDAPNKQATRFGKDAFLLGAPDTEFSIIGTTRAKSRGIAGYGQINYELFPHLELIAGIRYDYEKKEMSVLGEYQKDPDPNPQFETRPDTTAVTTFGSFSPKIGFSYRNANSNVYITYSKGYRTGGFTGFSSDPSQPPLYAYKPEFSNNVELGFKSDWYNNRLKLHAAAFFVAVKDAQVPTLVLPEAITITRNAGRLTSFGVETELDASPVKGLETGWHLGYTHARYTTLNFSSNGTEINLEGMRQVFTPDFTSLLYLQFTQPLNQSVSIHARGEWVYLGQQYFDLKNTIGQDPYSVFNLSAGASYKKLEAVFWMRNITDKRYIDYAYDFGAVHLANPQTLGVTLSARF